MKKALFIPYHGPNVDMCCNVAEVLEGYGVEPCFFAHEKEAQRALRYRKIFFQSFENNRSVSSVIDMLKPDIVISPHNLNPIGYLFVKHAKKRKIPTLLLHEGGSEVSKFLEEKKKTGYGGREVFPTSFRDKLGLVVFVIKKRVYGNMYMAHTGSDILAVASEKAKEFMLELGIKSDIVVTGQPRFDDIINNRYNDKKIREKYMVNDFVLILTSIVVVDGIWPSEKLVGFIRALSDILKDLGKDFIIKIHPRESVDFYKKIDSELKISKEDLYGLIHACDMVVSIPSTTTIESLMFKKTVILPDFLTKKPYSKELTPTVGVDSYQELREALEEGSKRIVLEDLERFTYRLDGKSSCRVAELVMEVI